MGLTLHYTFRLRNNNQIPQLVEEVEDICQSLNWEATRWDKNIPVEAQYMPFEEITDGTLRLQGIFFNPPGCETAVLTFTPQGWSACVTNLLTAEQIFEIDPKLVYCIHTKTQYAGVDIHVALVALLKYLEKKYFDAAYTDVSDEGNYWDTLDKDVLHERFDVYNGIIDAWRYSKTKNGKRRIILITLRHN